MIFAADILEHPAPNGPPDRDQRIAVAEMWLCMLDGLSDIGVRFAEFLTHGITPPKGGPKGPMTLFRFRGDPVVAFLRVWRAVRLAVALAQRIEDDIVALRAGKLPSWAAPATKAPCPRARPPKATRMGELAEAVSEAALEDIEAPERAEALFSEIHERLAEAPEDAAFYRLLNGHPKDAVTAICAELGLKLDWSQWTEAGFPPPPDGDVEKWSIFLAPPGETGPKPGCDPRERTPPSRKPVHDPGHLLDSPTRRLHDFLTAAGIEPRPPPPGAPRTFGAYPPIPLTS